MEEQSSDVVSLSCSEEMPETLNDFSWNSMESADDVIDLTNDFTRPSLKRSNAQVFSAPKPDSRRSRNFCFTINNPLMSGPELLAIIKGFSNFRYCVFQLETGESGTRHYQGFLQFTSPKRWDTVVKYLPKWALFICNGSPQQNVDYCTKTDTRIDGPWTAGEFITTGKRTDLMALAKKIENGESLSDIAKNDPTNFMKYASGIYKYARVVQQPPIRAELRVVLFIGPTNVGKTHQAYCNYPGAFIKDSSKWWEGYHGQKDVILDEFAGSLSQQSLDWTLRLLDKWPLRVENKGGSEPFMATNIIITTNVHPWNWYKWSGRELQLDALARRIHMVRIMNGREDFEWIELKDPDAVKHFFNDPEQYGFIKKVPEKA